MEKVNIKADEASEIGASFPEEKLKVAKKRARTSVVWDYFEKINDDSNTALCKSCGKVYKQPTGNTSNLWHHKKSCEKRANAFARLVPTNKRAIKRQPNSRIWEYFERQDDENNTAVCKACGKVYKRPTGNTSNLWNHKKYCKRLNLQLPSAVNGLPRLDANQSHNTPKIIEKTDRFTKSMLWEHFEKQQDTDNSVICKACGKLFRRPMRNPRVLLMHKKMCEGKLQKLAPPGSNLRAQPPKTANIWNYFDKVSNTTALCKLCGSTINRPCWNTSNLWAHRQRCAASKSLTSDCLLSSNGLSETVSDTNNMSDDNFISTSIDISKNNSMCSEQISEASTNGNLNLLCSLSKNTAYDIALYMIQDLPLYDAIEKPGFSHLIKKAFPDFVPVSSSQMFTNTIESMKERVDCAVRSSLQRSVAPISLFVDYWNCCDQTLMVIHAYYIDPMISSTSVCKGVLACKCFQFEPTSDIVWDVFMQTLNKWFPVRPEALSDMDSMVIGEKPEYLYCLQNVAFVKSVSDPAIVTSLATGTDRYEFDNCLYQKLYDVVGNGFNDFQCSSSVEQIFVRTRQMVSQFIMKPTLANCLRRIQIGLTNTEPLAVVRDRDSCWISTLHMLQRLLKLKNVISIMTEATSSDICCSTLSVTDWEILFLIKTILTHFENSAQKIKHAMMSEAIRILTDLCNVFEGCYEVLSSNVRWDLVEGLLTRLKSSLDSIMQDSLQNRHYIMACFFDTRHKHVLSSSHVTEAMKQVTSCLVFSHNSHLHAENLTHSAKWNIDSALTEDYAIVEEIPKPLDGTEIRADVHEAQVYANTIFDSSTNPIEYWLKKQATSPKLSNLALKYLSVPAANDFSNRAISKSAAFTCIGDDPEKNAHLENLFMLNLTLGTHNNLMQIFSD